MNWTVRRVNWTGAQSELDEVPGLNWTGAQGELDGAQGELGGLSRGAN